MRFKLVKKGFIYINGRGLCDANLIVISVNSMTDVEVLTIFIRIRYGKNEYSAYVHSVYSYTCISEKYKKNCFLYGIIYHSYMNLLLKLQTAKSV